MKIIRPSVSACRLKLAGVLAALLFLTVSCSYGVQFVDTSDNSKVYGDYSTFTKKITVVLPTGEGFGGKYYPLDKAELGGREGSLFSRSDVSTYLGLTGPTEGWRDWHAYLKGSRGAIMEVIFRYNDSQATGYGIARVDKGGEYRVSLGEGLRAPRGQNAPSAKPRGLLD